jgi:hypothetical protein
MRMLSSTMIKLLNVNEQPQKFFASEEERLKEIKQEFPDNELLEGITATSFLDSQFVSSQEKNQLSEMLGKDVDLVMKSALRSKIGERILEEVIYI